MPEWLSVTLAVVGALAAAYGLFAGGKKALADARAIKTPPPPTWPEMWAQMQEQDGKITDLQTSVRRLEVNEGRLVDYVMTLRDEVEAGLVPPLKPIPQWLVDLLERSRTYD